MIDLNTFLAHLTPEEREQHKALIEETAQRSSFISETTDKSMNLLKKKEQDLDEMKKRLNRSGEVLEGVGDSLASIHENGSHAKKIISSSNENLSDLKLAVDLHTFNIECDMKDNPA